QRVLVEREFLRAVEQTATDAVTSQRELVVEQQERVPGSRDLREVVEQEAVPYPGHAGERAVWGRRGTRPGAGMAEDSVNLFRSGGATGSAWPCRWPGSA